MLSERLQTEELMDDPSLDAATYHAVLADLAKVNAATFAYRPTLDFLARAVGNRSEFSLLDVGFGDGDMLRQIARWADRRSIRAHLTGIDLNSRSKAAAERSSSPGDPITYLTGDYEMLAGEGFDCIISSLVAHHMSHAQIIAFLRFMDREARAGWFINDLHRHGFAWLGFPLMARVMGWHRIVRLDGTTSIARSYRPDEWPPIFTEAGIEGAEVRRLFPFRLCIEKLR
ncbi:methyltransferase domain-containing protein [Altererythrobacter salegens]|uniref:Methyltransferase domain-containing protein n=1 Tax=Croceibacterium salegens TaxID=1737568 RepID=A0A6I4ST79_9SPHN|nr:methyltransferase domain-containing protein [Croceibacterium salegens]MXO59184.1 methyltransferase domain-containing protein [Croceibacterium salegens]